MRKLLYSDKKALIERLQNLQNELRSCGLGDEADMMMHPIAKLKSRRIPKP